MGIGVSPFYIYQITSYISPTSLNVSRVGGSATTVTSTTYNIGGRWASLANATAAVTSPGDVFRFKASPSPTSLGINGTWTSEAFAGSKAITGASNASPISITCTAHGYSTGETVAILGVLGNTAANGMWEITVTGANTFTLDGSTGNGTWSTGGTQIARSRKNAVVRLASPLTQNIASTGPRTSAWTALANVTTALTPSTTVAAKEHQYSDNINIAAGFATGLAAYYPTGTLNLSGYQQVSFWIRQASGTIGLANSCSLALCSDAAGATVVNTINIPALGSLNDWCAVTVDLGSALGSNINSIAFYVNTDNGAQNFYISNIIACKASSSPDSLTLNSLIGKNIAGDTWYGLQSINGTRVILDAATSTAYNSSTASAVSRGYNHSSGTQTVATYKRECIKRSMLASDSVYSFTISEAGLSTSPSVYTGGWDRTNMSTRTEETFLDGQNGRGYGFNSLNFVYLENFGFTRYAGGAVISSTGYAEFSNITGTCCGIGTIQNSNVSSFAKISNCVAQGNRLVSQSNDYASANVSNILAVNSPAGPLGGSVNTTGSDIEIRNCLTAVALSFGAGSCDLTRLVTVDNATAIDASASRGMYYLKDSAINESTEFTYSDGIGMYIFSHNHDNTPGNHKIFSNLGLIAADVTTRHTNSGLSWKFSPTSTTYTSSYIPLTLSIAKIAVATGLLVTVKLWMYRDNTGLTMNLVCKGGQISGVANDVVSTLTAPINTWSEQSITFTPSETGVVEIKVEAYGGTTFNGWVDDMTITQG
jgi:hypothetical protein